MGITGSSRGKHPPDRHAFSRCIGTAFFAALLALLFCAGEARAQQGVEPPPPFALNTNIASLPTLVTLQQAVNGDANAVARFNTIASVVRNDPVQQGQQAPATNGQVAAGCNNITAGICANVAAGGQQLIDAIIAAMGGQGPASALMNRIGAGDTTAQAELLQVFVANNFFAPLTNQEGFIVNSDINGSLAPGDDVTPTLTGENGGARQLGFVVSGGNNEQPFALETLALAVEGNQDAKKTLSLLSSLSNPGTCLPANTTCNNDVISGMIEGLKSFGPFTEALIAAEPATIDPDSPTGETRDLTVAGRTDEAKNVVRAAMPPISNEKAQGIVSAAIQAILDTEDPQKIDVCNPQRRQQRADDRDSDAVEDAAEDLAEGDIIGAAVGVFSSLFGGDDEDFCDNPNTITDEGATYLETVRQGFPPPINTDIAPIAAAPGQPTRNPVDVGNMPVIPEPEDDNDTEEACDLGSGNENSDLAPLTKDLKEPHDPCVWTRDNRTGQDGETGLDFAQEYEGGEQFALYFERWIREQWIPALKDMTAEWSAAIIVQTLLIGQAMDAAVVSEAITELQVRENEARQRIMPSELSCVSASGVTGATRAQSASNALRRSFKHVLVRRAQTGRTMSVLKE